MSKIPDGVPGAPNAKAKAASAKKIMRDIAKMRAVIATLTPWDWRPLGYASRAAYLAAEFTPETTMLDSEGFAVASVALGLVATPELGSGKKRPWEEILPDVFKAYQAGERSPSAIAKRLGVASDRVERALTYVKGFVDGSTPGGFVARDQVSSAPKPGKVAKAAKLGKPVRGKGLANRPVIDAALAQFRAGQEPDRKALKEQFGLGTQPVTMAVAVASGMWAAEQVHVK